MVPARAPLAHPGVHELAQRFEDAAISAAEWTHTMHLRVGAILVDRLGREGALTRLRAGIRRLNQAHGTGNSPTRGYHETITAAYVRLIAQFLASCPAGMPIEERIEEMVTGTLSEREFLLCFYSRERLMSEQARAEWVEPDLAPLPG
jgi:hypothetical protein